MEGKPLADDFVSRAEYDERLKRVDDENNRQNHRLDKLENLMEKINDLTIAVKELATNMKLMQQEQERQGERLESLEAEPAENWKTTVKTIITVVVSAAITYIIAKGGI
ncbi:MAG: hypothetical protein IKS01_00555 [Paludibacteraceae bacterium]|nr:hypothetical protein [Paludibacteraceae bacterium]